MLFTPHSLDSCRWKALKYAFSRKDSVALDHQHNLLSTVFIGTFSSVEKGSHENTPTVREISSCTNKIINKIIIKFLRAIEIYQDTCE